jgi:hypothetical protein
MQVSHGTGAPIHHQFAKRSLCGRFPAGAVRHDYVRQIEQLSPAMPVRQPEERVHAEQQA